jgi:hypothetical protein
MAGVGDGAVAVEVGAGGKVGKAAVRDGVTVAVGPGVRVIVGVRVAVGGGSNTI